MEQMQVSREGRLNGADMAVMLGSGLSVACRGFSVEGALAFADIPGLTAPGVDGHLGEIRSCIVCNKRCLFILGRKHQYEDAVDEVYTIIQFIASLGVGKLVVTSAAGSLSTHFLPGELVLINRIIDLQARKSFIGTETLAREFQVKDSIPVRERGARRNLLHTDASLMRRIRKAALVSRVRIGCGTLACLSGPFYETPAEVRALREIGADIVSMSAAPEVCFANMLGLDVAALCLVTNFATGYSKEPLDHSTVLEKGECATKNLRDLLIELIEAV